MRTWSLALRDSNRLSRAYRPEILARLAALLPQKGFNLTGIMACSPALAPARARPS